MSRYRSVFNITQNHIILPKGKWCAGAWCHFKGLMFRTSLPDDEGLIFVYGRESRMDTTIHMLFVFFSIAVIWLDADLQVIDTKLAKPWRPYYAPAKPAKYFIEGNPVLLERVAVGDHLRFDEGV